MTWVTYDVPHVDVDGRCSFGSIMRKYGLLGGKGLVVPVT
jgi:hypothetical protein